MVKCKIRKYQINCVFPKMLPFQIGLTILRRKFMHHLTILRLGYVQTSEKWKSTTLSSLNWISEQKLTKVRENTKSPFVKSWKRYFSFVKSWKRYFSFVKSWKLKKMFVKSWNDTPLGGASYIKSKESHYEKVFRGSDRTSIKRTPPYSGHYVVVP